MAQIVKVTKDEYKALMQLDDDGCPPTEIIYEIDSADSEDDYHDQFSRVA